MLNNAAMKAVNVEFGEDDQTYYGVTRSANAGQTYVAYWGRTDCTSAYLANGCTGTGTKDCASSGKNADGCQDYRNCCTSYTWVGEALIAQLMGAEALWNHGAFFDYVDRWMGYGKDPVVGSGDYIQPGATGPTFIADMWREYRPLAGGGSTTTNARPTANAGTDQTLADSDGSGSQTVTLDGSASTDSDGTIAKYTWVEGTTTVGTVQKPAVTLAVGQHTIVLTVTDNGGLTATDTVTVTVTAPSVDTVPPSVVSITPTGATTVEVLFSEGLSATTAQQTANYVIDNSIVVTSAVYQSTTRKVILTTSSLTQLETYNLTVSNVRDLAGNIITATARPYTYSLGLVGYWEFSETGGSTTQDSSGKGNKGSLVNAPVWTGKSQIEFTAPTQAVQVPTNGWNAGAGTVTIRAMVDTTAGVQFLFGHSVGAWSNRIQLYVENGALCLGLGDSHVTAAGIAAIAAQTWYDIAFTWNGTQYTVYVDGASKASGTYTGLTSLASTVDIGNDGLASVRSEAMSGQVDRVRLYSRALSSAEIGAIYNTDRSYLFQPIGDKTVDEGSTLSFTVVPLYSTETIALTSSTLPGRPTFSRNVFTWTPAAGTEGVYEATFTATYGALSDSETITITVNGLNSPPVIGAIANKTVNEAERLSFTVTATDADGQTPTLAAANLPRGATFANGTFDWTPGYDQAGAYSVLFTATDGLLTTSRTVTVTVVDVATSSVATVIIDNGAANTSSTGTWAASGAAGSYLTASVWARDGATYSWTFRPTVSGSYNVSMWWTAWSSRSMQIPVAIQSSSGTAAVYVNQQLNGGMWNGIGTYNFVAGNSYKVTITSQPDPTSTSADAVRFVYAGNTPDIIVDNKDTASTARTGTWTSSGSAGYYGTDSLWSRDGATFTWNATVPKTGRYQVSMWWTAWPSRSTQIPVNLIYAGGSARIYVNQQLNGGTWNSLGTYTFNAGTKYPIGITAQPYPTSTCADAIKLTYVP
jgi:hypothetical protein